MGGFFSSLLTMIKGFKDFFETVKIATSLSIFIRLGWQVQSQVPFFPFLI